MLKHFKPNTPGQRQLVLINKQDLWKGKPEKTLREGIHSSGGRNNLGRITAFHRGGGHKQRYRIIDFKRNKDNMIATVERLEYDPNRTAFIALLEYQDKTKSYILAPQRLSVGDKVVSGSKIDIKIGNTLPLKDIPIGTIVHSVEMKIGKGGQLSRSAGSYRQIIGRESKYVQLRLSSGEVRIILSDCRATIGAVSNPDQKNISLGKAGRSRWKGRLPVTRGVAMNPVDHPHGGGEGRTSGGRHPVTPWGKPTKGKKTRSEKNPTNKWIIRRRNQK